MSARSFNLEKRRQGNITIDKTTVEGEGEQLRVILHATPVITKMPDGSIVLNSNGYKTATTKVAINRGLNLLGVKCVLWQNKGSWYVNHNGQIERFIDNMVLR